MLLRERKHGLIFKLEPLHAVSLNNVLVPSLAIESAGKKSGETGLGFRVCLMRISGTISFLSLSDFPFFFMLAHLCCCFEHCQI